MGRDAHGSDDLSTAVASRLGCEEIVRFLHETRRLRGLAFVERATEVLARELGVDVVFVGRLLDGSQAVRSVVVVDGGERAGDFVYDLAGTPCENVVGNETCIHIRGVADAFPDDAMLRAGGFDGYVGTPLFDLDDAPIGLVVVLHRRPLDDPERIRAVFELWSDRIGVELDRHLERRRRRDLEARLAGLDRMDAAATAQTLVHDLNNVLAAISTHAELICDDVPATSDAHASARAILDAARVAAAACERARRAAAPPRTAVEPADLVSAARSVLELLRPRTPDRVVLVFEPGIPTAPVLADRVQLERLLINLTTNAIDAVAARGGPGRVLVSIDDEAPHGRPMVRLTVRDDGCGMTPAVRARLFEPFYSTKGHGRGLGMASIAHVVDALAGEIEIDSTVGTGTTVTVRLPRCARPP